MKKHFLTAALTGAIALSMTGCYFFPAEEELLSPPTVAIEDVVYSTYTARTKTIESKTTATGYVVSRKEYEASFPESGGVLKKIYVTAGQFVEEGDLLAEIDTGDLEYRYEQQKLIVQKAQLAAAAGGNAALDYEMEKNTLDEYERQLKNAKLYAGMSGQVCFVEALNPGATVSAYKTVVKIANPDEMLIQYKSNNMKFFPLGTDVTITIDGKDYKGYVSKTPTEITEGLYDDCEVIKENTDSLFCEFRGEMPSALTIGMLADIAAVYEVHENVVIISKNLVKTDGDRTYVTILDENDNKIEVDVVTGIENATEIEIVSGLNAGDRVVIR